MADKDPGETNGQRNQQLFAVSAALAAVDIAGVLLIYRKKKKHKSSKT